MHRGDCRGFTLIELLIVIVIISIVAAIAIPGLINSLHRSKQARTMSDLRAIGSAVEAYAVDQSAYPNAGDIATLASVLEPVYIRSLPGADGWGNSLLVSSSGTAYTIGSAGLDGGASLSLNGSGGPTSSFTDDIIFADGLFIQWPEGTQQ